MYSGWSVGDPGCVYSWCSVGNPGYVDACTVGGGFGDPGIAGSTSG